MKIVMAKAGLVGLVVGSLVGWALASSSGLAWGAEDRGNAASRQYAAAVALQNKGEYALAADEWSRFLSENKDDPRRDRAYYYLGICQLKLGKADAARNAFETLIDNFAESKNIESAYFFKGLANYIAGQQGKVEQFDAAATAFAAFVEKFPKSERVAEALFYQGESLYARQKRAEAAKLYEAALAKSPSEKLVADALYALGVAREELNEHPAAAKAYDRFLEQFKEHPLRTEVLMRRGDCDFAAGDFGAAAQRFAAAAGTEGFALADYALLRNADALAKSKQWADAAKLYASLPEKFPKSVHVTPARLAGARAYFQAAEYAKARSLLEALLAGSQDDASVTARAEAWHWAARCWLKEGSPKEVIVRLTADVIAGLSKSSWVPTLLLDRADAMYELPEQRAASVVAYAEIAEKYPKAAEAPQAAYLAAFTALEVRQYEAAKSYAEKFLKEYPGHELTPDVLAIAAEVALQLKDYPRAQQLFERLLSDHAGHADAELWLVRHAVVFFVQKKYAETIAALEPSLKKIASPDMLAEAQYLIGASRFAAGEHRPAIEAFTASQQASQKWRQADEVLLLLAQAQHASEATEAAVGTLRKLLADFPKSKLTEQARYRLGEYLAAAKQWEAAAQEYKLALQTWPQGEMAPYSLLGLAWTHYQTQDYAGAEAAVDQLERGFKDHAALVRARYLRGMARQQLRKYAEAIADLESYLKQDLKEQEKAEAGYLLALCQSGLKRYDEAAATLKPLAAAQPPLPFADKVNYELGWALKSAGKTDEAYAAFAQAAAVNPEGPLVAECAFHLGERDYLAGRFDDAAKQYAQAVVKAGNDDLAEKAQHKFGWSLYMKPDYAAAQTAFEEQRRRWPKGPLAADAAFMIAESLFQQRKYDLAAAAYAAAPKSAIANAEVLSLLHRAQALAQLKKWSDALRLLDQLLKDHPEHNLVPEALFEKGMVLRAMDKPGDAVKAWEAVVAATGREVAARAQFMIGQIQFEQKQHEEAVKSFFRVIYGYGFEQWQADASYEAARCFEVLKKTEQALKLYEELVSKHPNSDKASLAKDRIAVLKKQ